MSDTTDDMRTEPDFEAEAHRLRGRVTTLEVENTALADIIVEGQGIGALPHDGVAYGYMPKRIAELESENERLRHGMSVLCREFREAAQEDAEEGGAMVAAYSADRIDVLLRRP